MTEQRARDLFLDWQRGSISRLDAEALSAFLAANPSIKREFQENQSTLEALDFMPLPKPSPKLRAGVFAAIEAEKRLLRAAPSALPAAAPQNASRRLRWFWPVQAFAASALLALGFFFGERHPAVPSNAAASDNVALEEKIAGLEKQVTSMGRLVGYSLVQQQQRPTSDRLRTVLASASIDNPPDHVINDLIGALELDPSANVRLNALEALYPHAQQEIVRASVLESLPREQSPVVQVAIIDFLVATQDHDATTALEKISSSVAADQNVRNAARRALAQL